MAAGNWRRQRQRQRPNGKTKTAHQHQIARHAPLGFRRSPLSLSQLPKSNTVIEMFRQHLEQNPKIKVRQIRQAIDAVIIYKGDPGVAWA